MDHIPGAKQTNLSFRSHDNIPVYDVRKHDTSMTLDKEGFQLAHFDSSVHRDNFKTVEAFDSIKTSFFEELEQFVVKKLGATWGKVYSCDIRRRAGDYPQVQFSKESQPLRAVHCDHSVQDGENVVNDLLQSEGETRPGRAQLITVWKPLQEVVRDWPLGLCDYQSIDPSLDAIEVDLVFPDGPREGINLFHNKQHVWWFLSDQAENEVWLIKTYDSISSADATVAPFAPHGAFDWKDCSLPKEMRQSIETRVVVYTATS